MFHHKPITLVGMNGILASPVLITFFSITTIARWNYVKEQFSTAHYWIFFVFGCIIIGTVINVLIIIVFTMMSPMYACCFFPFRLIFDLIFQYIYFGKKTHISIYMVSIICFSSGFLGIVGKYKILKQKKEK